MEPKRLYVDFHVLQTVPPSCVNRDDTGSPKTAVTASRSATAPKRSSGWWRMRSKPWRRGRMQKRWRGMP